MSKNDKLKTSGQDFNAQLYDQESKDTERTVKSLEKHIKNDLQELEAQLKKLISDSEKVSETLEKLSEVPIIIEYKRLVSINNSIKAEIKKIGNQIRDAVRSQCSHPIWYFAGPENPGDPFGDVNNQYICLECLEERYNISKRENIVKSDLSLGQIREEYQNFKEKYSSFQETHGEFVNSYLKDSSLFQNYLDAKKQKSKQK